jgi:hypothetical protein
MDCVNAPPTLIIVVAVVGVPMATFPAKTQRLDCRSSHSTVRLDEEPETADPRKLF